MSWLARYERWLFKRSIRRLARADARAAVGTEPSEPPMSRRERRWWVRRTARLLAKSRLDEPFQGADPEGRMLWVDDGEKR